MKQKLRKTILFIVSLIMLFSLYKGKVEAQVQYSDAVIDNLASVISSEIGCGNKDEFVYELIWGAVFVNNYNYYFESGKTPSTVVYTQENMCNMFKHKKVYSPDYCYFSFSKGRATQCNAQERERLRLAAKMVLYKSFTIPRNVYLAAEKAVLDKYGVNWVSFRPAIGGWVTYFGYQKGDTLSTKDIYGNTVRTDEQFYHDLANCLYDHPTLYGAYNNCSDTTIQIQYKVYLYPNGGTGIKDGHEFEYSKTTTFDKFPKVKKDNCTLDGWNVGSPDGEKYYTDVRPADDGKKLYARWNCAENEYTVTFKTNDGTGSVYATKKVVENKTVSAPNTNPTRSGYTFSGWMTQDGKEFNFSTKIKKNITLYADWQLKNSASSPSSSKQNSTSKPTKPSSGNPDTGGAKTIVAFILLLASLIAAIYYRRNYKEINDNQNL